MSQRTPNPSNSKSTLKWLKDVRIYVNFKKGVLRKELEPQQQQKLQKHRKGLSKLKNFEIAFSFSGEWYPFN